MRLTERKKELITGLGILLLFGLGLGAAEGTLRVVQAFKYGEADVVEKGDKFYRDERTGLRLPKPGARIGRVRINSLGFRGPDIPPTAPPHTLRLAFLGSSTTYDAASPEGQNWPEQTARRFGEHLPDGCRIDFVNAGLPGFGTEHMQRHFDANVVPLRPDVVVILAGDVTGDMQDGLEARGMKIADLVAPSTVGEYSLAWRKIEKNLRIIRLQRSALRPDGKIRFDPDAHVPDYERRLSSLVGAVSSAGALPVLVTTAGQIRHEQSPRQQVEAAQTALFFNPYLWIPDLLEARDTYNAAIVRVARATGALLVEGENDIPGDRDHFVDSAHFTPRGSALMARRMVAGVLPTAAFGQRLQRIGGPCAAPLPDKPRAPAARSHDS